MGSSSLGRRVRRNYLWIMVIQLLAYAGKLIIHPTPANDISEFVARASIGPISGELVLLGGAAYCFLGVALSIWVKFVDARRIERRGISGEAIA
ncbi:DUF2270 domain-containing protein [Primorskyibacter aestuariivivens]|uniref:DUF2270 domain-containing protein n=1 Tax=Primorskyibacter aestuariivivens TaxID=1888912 RepID=UPI0038CD2BFB